MISQRLFLLVLITLACRELADHGASVAPRTAFIAALGATLGFGLLFKVSVIRVLAQSTGGNHFTLWQRMCTERRRIETAWVIALPAVLLATGWGPMFIDFQSAGLPQTIAVLGWFAPSLALFALLELTVVQFDEYCLPTSVPDVHRSHHWADDWLARLRLGDMASLATCLVPILIVTAFTEVGTATHFERLTPGFQTACSLLAVGCVVLFLPQWLGLWMGVVDLPNDELGHRIRRQLSELGLRGVQPRLLPSHGRWPGAAVVGWLPRFRQLWLGDALVERLTPRELDMVVMHELAHLTRLHFAWRLLPILAVVVLVGITWIVWPLVPFSETSRTCVVSCLAALGLLIGLRQAAHACELDADQAACSLASQVCEWAHESPGLAAQEMLSALRVLLADSPDAARASWLHPSLAQRTQNLQNLG